MIIGQKAMLTFLNRNISKAAKARKKKSNKEQDQSANKPKEGRKSNIVLTNDA